MAGKCKPRDLEQSSAHDRVQGGREEDLTVCGDPVRCFHVEAFQNLKDPGGPAWRPCRKARMIKPATGQLEPLNHATDLTFGHRPALAPRPRGGSRREISILPSLPALTR